MSVYSEGCDSQTDPMDAEEEEGVSEEQYEQAFCAIVNEVFSKEDGEKYLDYENFNVQVEKLTKKNPSISDSNLYFHVVCNQYCKKRNLPTETGDKWQKNSMLVDYYNDGTLEKYSNKGNNKRKNPFDVGGVLANFRKPGSQNKKEDFKQKEDEISICDVMKEMKIEQLMDIRQRVEERVHAYCRMKKITKIRPIKYNKQRFRQHFYPNTGQMKNVIKTTTEHVLVLAAQDIQQSGRTSLSMKRSPSGSTMSATSSDVDSAIKMEEEMQDDIKNQEVYEGPGFDNFEDAPLKRSTPVTPYNNGAVVSTFNMPDSLTGSNSERVYWGDLIDSITVDGMSMPEFIQQAAESKGVPEDEMKKEIKIACGRYYMQRYPNSPRKPVDGSGKIYLGRHKSNMQQIAHQTVNKFHAELKCL